MPSVHSMARHARVRSAQRHIPHRIAEMIIEFGQSKDARDGTNKYMLTKQSMRELRRTEGKEIANAMEKFRARNAYVVAAGAGIVTVAFASSPLFS